MNVLSTFITFICILICINSANSQEINEDTPRENSKTNRRANGYSPLLLNVTGLWQRLSDEIYLIVNDGNSLIRRELKFR